MHTEVLVTSATSRSVLIPPPKTTIFKDDSSFQREIDISNKIPQLRREYKKKAADRINDLKEFPKKLIYVGNFPDAIRPQKEFIPHGKENIITVSWKHFDETFESKMIKRYCEHNLRELSIYHKDEPKAGTE